MSLRGGCPESDIDREYVMIFDEKADGFSKLIGSSVFEIRFAASRPGWEVFDVAKELVLAYTHTPDYPIGSLPVSLLNLDSIFRDKPLDVCQQL